MTPDLCSRTYTAEVLRSRGTDPAKITETIARLTTDRRPPEQLAGPADVPIEIAHSFLPSVTPYHRSVRTVENERGAFTVPRTKTIRGAENFLYDVLLARYVQDVIVAVPYHALAEVFFVQVDRALAGMRAVYEKLDITNLVIRLGQTGLTEILPVQSPHKLEIGVTRCQLSYSDPEGRSRDLQQLSMSGGHLGRSDVYRQVIAPVISPGNYPLTVTPVLIGFALFTNGIKKTSATTDRHGNFKLWVGPGATRIERLFSLLRGVESIQGVVSTTGNLPILQSRAIREIEEG